jgi:hypothetical protein
MSLTGDRLGTRLVDMTSSDCVALPPKNFSGLAKRDHFSMVLPFHTALSWGVADYQTVAVKLLGTASYGGC